MLILTFMMWKSCCNIHEYFTLLYSVEIAVSYTAIGVRSRNLVVISIWTFMAWKLLCNAHTYVYGVEIAL
jgi:hypothetical protein